MIKLQDATITVVEDFRSKFPDLLSLDNNQTSMRNEKSVYIYIRKGRKVKGKTFSIIINYLQKCRLYQSTESRFK
jgi:hypothetical protein